MVFPIGGARAVRKDQAFVSAVVRLTHRGVHADVGGDTREDQMSNPPRPQQQVEVRGVERAFARLVNDRLTLARRHFRNDLPSRLTSHQDSSAWSDAADLRPGAGGSPALVRREVGEVGSVALPGVDDGHAGVSCRSQHARGRLQP